MKIVKHSSKSLVVNSVILVHATIPVSQIKNQYVIPNEAQRSEESEVMINWFAKDFSLRSK
jgi:hypothetical protein